MQKLSIALDWDFTFTEDCDLWAGFVKLARVRGHDVYIVTARYNYQTVDIFIILNKYDLEDMKVFTSGHTPKKEYLESLDICPDIWIDDDPSWILGN